MAAMNPVTAVQVCRSAFEVLDAAGSGPHVAQALSELIADLANSPTNKRDAPNLLAATALLALAAFPRDASGIVATGARMCDPGALARLAQGLGGGFARWVREALRHG